MKKLTMIGAALLLAACSKSPDQKLKAEAFNGCRSSGGPEEMCQCVIDKISDKYSDKQLAEYYEHQDRIPPKFVDDSLKAAMLCATDPKKSLKDIDAEEAAQAAASARAQSTESDTPVDANEASTAPDAPTAPDDTQGAHDAESAPAAAASMESLMASYREADGALNRSYKQAMGRLDAAGKSALRDAQRAWLKQRDSECNATGGLASNQAGLQCLLDKTSQRTQELNNQ